MFHVNAWGLPYVACLVGAKMVYPGPHLDGKSLYVLFESERRHDRLRGADHFAGPPWVHVYEGKIAKWWTPDDVAFVESIPLGPTGKMQKNMLREALAGHQLPG